MALYLGSEQLLNKEHRVRMTLNPRGAAPIVVEGNVQSDFNINGRNDFGTGLGIADSAGIVSGGIASIISDAFRSGRGIMGAIRGQDIVSVWESESVWQGSAQPIFNLDLTFLCMRAGDEKTDVINRVNKIMSGVYPDFSSSTDERLNRVATRATPPLGYRRDDSQVGKVNLEIGEWFSATKLVLENASFTYSKEINRDGRPLYAVGQVTLKPYRMISYDEFLGYFQR